MKKYLLTAAIFIIMAISFFLLTSCDEKKPLNSGEEDKKETEISFYEYCYSKASGQKQIDELDELSEDKSLGWGEWRRDALIIIGELPKDIGRVTLNDAEKIVNKGMSDLESIAYFNEIAGAPDWMGGSGIGRAIYYLNDEKTEAVICILGEVHYFVIKENGEYVQLPIGNQVLLEPKETDAIFDSDGMLKLAKDISELEGYTDAIVIATVSEAKARPESVRDECVTLTDILIDEIIMNDGKLSEGGTVTLIEYYRTEPYPEDESVKRIISTDATLPLKTGSQYLLFLRKAPAEQEYGEYAIALGWQGKYPITQALRNKEIHEITTGDLEWRKENEYAIGKDIEGKVTIMLAKQVIEKYIRR